MIVEFVDVAGRHREVLGQQAPTVSMAETKPSARRLSRAWLIRSRDDAVPPRLVDPGVDAGVGDDLGVALGQRDEDQDAGARRRQMDVAGVGTACSALAWAAR